MYLIKTLRWVVLICTFTSASVPINAHTLKETTAQVILRDGQVEVKIITDIEHLISALQNSHSWLLGDIETIMPANLNHRQQKSFIKNALKQKLNLVVNGQIKSFEHVVFSNDNEIIFQAQHSFSEVTNISISFHKMLGAVHVNFVKPKYKLLVAGETAHVVF